MIIIYEKADLTEMGRKRCFGIAPVCPAITDIDPDVGRLHAYAETVYVTEHDGNKRMIKARNAPLDPFPVTIKVERDISF